MSRQDKATTEKFGRTLRELVKQPENKTCADCKRNDPRWASWNLGVFLCIRCSGIHRGMGTHISKVKSVDLDVWTPEQMESIQKWGNHLANLYWEAHLKPGHIPPEHKMESFIRSKYETKRWAMEGPLPANPSVLESGNALAASATVPPSSSEQVSPPQPTSTTSRTSTNGSRPQSHQLLSANYSTRLTKETPSGSMPSPFASAPAPQTTSVENDIFSLDFRAPAVTADVPAPKKDVKQDILSLFSSNPVAPTPTIQQGNVPQQQFATPTSMLGSSGTGMWGTSSGWNGSASVIPPQPNIWNAPTSTPQSPSNLFDTNSIWGNNSNSTSTTAQDWGSFNSAAPKKDEVFGDIWGSFK